MNATADSPERHGSDLYRRIYQQVRRIPPGRVATYGQIAALAGFPRHARSVGYALFSLRDADHDPDRGGEVPWQRVINAQGRVSPRSEPGWDGLQEQILREEGVEIGLDGSIDLKRYQWKPRPGRRRDGGRSRGGGA